MKASNFTTTILKADENHFLTNADPATEILNRVVATTIAIGKYDSADNYIEIDKEQADEYKRLIDEAQEEERKRIEEEANRQEDSQSEE